MRIVAYGDIMELGTSAFTTVAKVDGTKLAVSFQGEIRVDNPYNHLRPFLDTLQRKLKDEHAKETELDFTELRFCNSNGFYVIMDIAEVIYRHTEGPVQVLRLGSDDWQQETLPILIDIDDPDIAQRTTFEERVEL